uniref:Zn(2)-C6 fungal-type domain-containing protein n=1 Tax=Fusarium oxysporum (strain Fo5176) TaxID=660025 RepID=A0A0D2XKF7_FUSOF
MEIFTRPAEIHRFDSDNEDRVSGEVSKPGRANRQDPGSSSQSSVSPDCAQQPGHPRSDNATSSGTYTGGVYPGGSVKAVNVQGLGSPPQALSSPESPLSSSEQANPRHGSHGTPLHATIPSGHGLSPESSASESDSSSGSGSSECSEASRSVNGTQLISPPGDDAGHLQTDRTDLELDFPLRRGAKDVPGSLLSPETLRDSPSQEVQAQVGLGRNSDDDDDSDHSDILDQLGSDFNDLLSIDPGRPITGSPSRDRVIASRLQDEDSDLEVWQVTEDVPAPDTSHDNGSAPGTPPNGIRRVVATAHSPEPNHHYETSDEDDAESVDDTCSGFSGSNGIGNDERIVEPEDPEEGNEESNVDNDLVRQFDEVVADHSDSDGFETHAGPSAVSSWERRIYLPPSDYDDSDEEAGPQNESSDDEEVSEEEIGYISDARDTDVEIEDETESSTLSIPSSSTNGIVSPSEASSSGSLRLTFEEREVVRITREIGACVRCRFQKIKCLIDENNPEGQCKTCKKFSKTSPKTIHRVPCLRLRIADVVLYRSGGLKLTRRWAGIEMRDIGDRLDTVAVTIEVSQNLCGKPLRMNVVRFRPIDGDVTARYWTDGLLGKVIFKKKELANYCLENIYDTAESNEHKSGGKLSKDDEKELEIFGNLFILWCAIRSLYIEGNETLGMLPETEDKSYPLYGKVSVPRMIVAQFDTLNYNEVLERYKEKLLRDIDWLFSQDKNRWWFTTYLVRYSIPDFVEGLHGSCNNILIHWHYYNCDQWPTTRLSGLTNGIGRNDHFETLAPKDRHLVKQNLKDPEVKKHLLVWKKYKRDNGKVPKITLQHDAGSIRYAGKQDKYDWDHSLYWVSQMFEKKWYPHPTYTSEQEPESTLMTVTTAVAAAG